VKRIFDPVHQFIELEPGEARLLDLAPMQRLRRLRQLGLAYLAFPSAEHSRFTHALGAFAMGTRAYDTLARHDGGGRARGEYERRLARCALLLHDIGHGPFSHACEAVLGIAHEARTREILALPEMRKGIEALDLDPADVLGTIVGDPNTKFPIVRALVSGPNLDADRMDYLLRDAYFTGVSSGRYDADQLVASLRIFERNDAELVGIDVRGVVALESFVVARYMMFASVYFHHTTRLFERILQDVLRELWPDPRKLDAIDEFLAWDDFRVLNDLRDVDSGPARALRERIRVYALAAEFTTGASEPTYARCKEALLAAFGADAIWADEQEQLLHRLPADDSRHTVWVGTPAGLVDARKASDLIAKLTGKAYFRKLFVRRDRADVRQARRICSEIIAASLA
jgi:uncharacterized protein